MRTQDRNPASCDKWLDKKTNSEVSNHEKWGASLRSAAWGRGRTVEGSEYILKGASWSNLAEASLEQVELQI